MWFIWKGRTQDLSEKGWSFPMTTSDWSSSLLNRLNRRCIWMVKCLKKIFAKLSINTLTLSNPTVHTSRTYTKSSSWRTVLLQAKLKTHKLINKSQLTINSISTHTYSPCYPEENPSWTLSIRSQSYCKLFRQLLNFKVLRRWNSMKMFWLCSRVFLRTRNWLRS